MIKSLFILLIVVSVLLSLLGFLFCIILSKISNIHGETEFEGEFKLFGIFRFKIKTKHKNNKK